MTRAQLTDTAIVLANIFACLWVLKGCHELQVAKAACKGPYCVAEQWTPEARLQAARGLWGEAGPEAWRYADASALPHIWVKRWQQRVKVEPDVTLATVITRYAKPLRAKHLRGQLVQSLPWGPLDGSLRQHNDDWVRILVHVGRVAQGRIGDPCRVSNHYGGVKDEKPGGFRRVCRWLKSKNLLYKG